LCQNIYGIEDLFDVILDPYIHRDYKRPYMRFLLWAYLYTAQVQFIELSFPFFLKKKLLFLT